MGHGDGVAGHHQLHCFNLGYDKGTGNAFAITGAHLAIATHRAEQLARRFSAHTDPEPFTAIVELVKLLTMLRG